MRPRGRYLVRVVTLLVLLGVLWVTHRTWLPSLAHWLDVSGPLQVAEYAMVMGGGVENRPVVAAILWKKGWVEKILISEIKVLPSEFPPLLPPEHELTRALLTRLGVPDDCIVTLRGNHAATFHEIQSLKQILANDPHARVLIVTDSVHTRRTAWSVRHVLGPNADRVGFVGATTDDYALSNWWQSADGFYMVISEYLKLLFYMFRYGQGLFWLTGVVVVLVGATVLRRLVLRARRLKAPQSPAL